MAAHKEQSHDLMTNVEMAEEQPAAQIAAVQKKEPKQKLPWKSPEGSRRLPAAARRDLVDLVLVLIRNT